MGHKYVHPDDGMAYACPECEATMLYKRNDGDVTCRGCHHRFPATDVGERSHTRTATPPAGARAKYGDLLDDADPDDIATDGGEDMIKACPMCDYSAPKKKRSSYAQTPRSRPENYYCANCGGHFDEPVKRPSKHPQSGYTASSVANALIDADPDAEIRPAGGGDA